ncbi:MAG: hypothetical protein ACLT5V_03310 [Enterococcus avium]
MPTQQGSQAASPQEKYQHIIERATAVSETKAQKEQAKGTSFQLQS